MTRTAVITSRWRLPKWSSLSRGNGHRITVLAHRPGRYPAHRLAALRPCRSRPQGGPSLRRGPEPPASSRKGTSREASPLRSGTLLVDLEGEIRCQGRQCPGLRRAFLLDAGSPLIDKPRYRRAGGAVWRPVEAMRLIRLLGGRLGAVRQRKAYRRRDIPQPRRRACAAHHRVVEQPSRRILWKSL